MDVKVAQTETCSCGRNVISVAGTCAQCISEGRALLELYLTGKITFPGYMRRLRRKGK